MQKKQNVESIAIVGISVRTSNKNGEASVDLGVLWERFYLENVHAQIPNIISGDIYCVYTDYESDYTGEYTAIIGYKVPFLGFIPEGLTGCLIEEGEYLKYTIRGEISSIADVWAEIWANDSVLNRKYGTDFDVYKEKSQDIEHAEMEVYIGVR
ncbi:MAG: effector binding domain-containing protein [Flavobacteriaceae bacterium]|jgi:predicted transcriptional regulator YdeE|nr:effector binding domain-containing protein [Flavobacteriaceae bacterium]